MSEEQDNQEQDDNPAIFIRKVDVVICQGEDEEEQETKEQEEK